VHKGIRTPPLTRFHQRSTTSLRHLSLGFKKGQKATGVFYEIRLLQYIAGVDSNPQLPPLDGRHTEVTPVYGTFYVLKEERQLTSVWFQCF
jgi:hypothetical protein